MPGDDLKTDEFGKKLKKTKKALKDAQRHVVGLEGLLAKIKAKAAAARK